MAVDKCGANFHPFSPSTKTSAGLKRVRLKGKVGCVGTAVGR